MKTFSLSVILASCLSFLAQAEVKNDQKLLFLKCSGGAKKQSTVLNIYSGGLKGGIFARIQQGKFDSGEIKIEEPSGMVLSGPEDRSYVDTASQGMRFSFSYNMRNPSAYNRLDYVNPAHKVPALPELVCTSTRQLLSKAN